MGGGVHSGQGNRPPERAEEPRPGRYPAMTFSPVLKFLKEHVVGTVVGSALLGASLTLATTDLVSFRSSTRTAIQSEYEKSIGSQAEVETLIQKFSARARGAGVTSDADVDALRNALDKTYVAAENLANRVPKLRPDFLALSQQMIALQASAEALKGPADGAQFVHSLSEYYFALQRFNNDVVSEQNTWVALR